MVTEDTRKKILSVDDPRFKALPPQERLSVFITDIRGVKTSFLSEKTGLDVNKINLILNDKRNVNLNEFQSFCRALNEPATTFISLNEIVEE